MKIIYIISFEKTLTNKAFECQTKITGGATVSFDTSHQGVSVSRKQLWNFWLSFDLSFINCEIEIGLLWSKDYIISVILRTPAVTANPAASAEPATLTTWAIL